MQEVGKHALIHPESALVEIQSFSQLFCYCLSKAKRNWKRKCCAIQGIHKPATEKWTPLLTRITDLYTAGKLANQLKKERWRDWSAASAYASSEQQGEKRDQFKINNVQSYASFACNNPCHKSLRVMFTKNSFHPAQEKRLWSVIKDQEVKFRLFWTSLHEPRS